MNHSEIIQENSRRLARLLAPYDPLVGFDPDKLDLGRAKSDFPYWAASSCFIKNKKGGEDIRFVLNYPQRKLVAELEKMRTMGKPIRLLLLKARQWGGSTCLQMYMAWLQLIHCEGLNSLIVAHQHSATSEIRDMFVRMIKNYSDKCHEPNARCQGRENQRPTGNGLSIKPGGPGAIKVPERNFKVRVGSAERPDSVRGGDCSLVHCSEVAFWKKTRLKTPEDMLRSATSGVLLHPMTMIVLESTANGTDNFFHSEYEAAVKGQSQFVPLFIAWFEIEQYSLPMDPEERERFADWLLKIKDNEQPENERSQSGAYLWWLWEKGATLEAINWYVRERSKYSDHGQMASEYPSDDVEAFVNSGAKVFDKYKVELLKAGCDLMAERGEVNGDAPSGNASLQNVRFEQSDQGILRVWKLPEKLPHGERITNRYLTVVDIGGRSHKADWSVIAVFDREPMLRGEPVEVVAQWRGHTDFDLLAWNAARIAKFYDESLLVIESNTLETHDTDRLVEGDQSHYLLHQLRQAYSHLYMRKASAEEIRQGKPVKYGFHTNVSTKPLIITNLVMVVREGMYVERDPMCIHELLAYEQKSNGSYGAVSGKHDDILMTRAIGLHICYNEMPAPRREESDYYFNPCPRGGYATF